MSATPFNFVPFWLSGAQPPAIPPARVTRAMKARYDIIPDNSIEAREARALRDAVLAELGLQAPGYGPAVVPP